MAKDTPQWQRKPKGWTKTAWDAPMQYAFRGPNGLLVITSDPFTFPDEIGTWVHVSMSRVDKIPSYEDMALVKKLFIGRKWDAIQVFPRESEHVNIHPFCLHLWGRRDERSHPEFTMGTGTI